MSNYTIKTIKGIDAIKDYSEMREMQAHIGEFEYRIFLQQGFFHHYVSSSNLHNHRYSEIHVVKSGTMDLYVNGERIRVPQQSAVIIPPGVYHTRRCEDEENTFVCAFQTDLEAEELRVVDIGSVSDLLFEAIEIYNEKGVCKKLSSLLSLVCASFCSFEPSPPTPIHDREFIIYEFFANNYDKDVTLADIALQLRLSEKQAERLIVKSTGMSFRRHIITKRIENAKILAEFDGMSLAKAAEIVGYQSYSGFWKALQSYENNSDT